MMISFIKAIKGENIKGVNTFYILWIYSSEITELSCVTWVYRQYITGRLLIHSVISHYSQQVFFYSNHVLLSLMVTVNHVLTCWNVTRRGFQFFIFECQQHIVWLPVSSCFPWRAGTFLLPRFDVMMKLQLLINNWIRRSELQSGLVETLNLQFNINQVWFSVSSVSLSACSAAAAH